MFAIGDEVLCIDDSVAPHIAEEVQKDFEMWVKKGKKYTIRSFNENDSIVVGVLLEEIHNFPKFFRLLGRSQEPSFATWRFRKLVSSEEMVNVESEVEVNV